MSLSPGSVGNAETEETQRDDDPDSITGWLLTTEDCWRKLRRVPAAMGHSPAAALAFIREHLTWAAGHHWFIPFREDLSALHGRLEAITSTSDRPERGVACVHCGTKLVRTWRTPRRCAHVRPEPRSITVPHPNDPKRTVTRAEPADEYRKRLDIHDRAHARCDQGGLSDSWECRRCRRVLTGQEHAQALKGELLEDS